MTSILIIIVIAIALPFIIALLIPRNYNYFRSIKINRPVEDVFSYVKYLKNQDHYSKWNMIDPNSRKTFKGEDGTVGFVYAWDSANKQAGAGEQEIVRVNENDRIGTELRFERPFRNVANGYIITEPAGGGTKVTWGMTGRSKMPMNLMNAMVKGMLLKDISESLQNLKRILEE
jgi:hypothetical protein